MQNIMKFDSERGLFYVVRNGNRVYIENVKEEKTIKKAKKC